MSGDLLNKQGGFHNYYDSWTCIECYHSNRISEDEIYESEEVYQKRRYADEDENCDNEDDDNDEKE